MVFREFSFEETVFLLILLSYKYHNIAGEQRNTECNVLSSVLLFFYQSVQFLLEAAIILLIALSYLSGGKFCEFRNNKWLKS